MNQESVGNRTWFPALDGLRGLAATWVVVGHVAQATPLYNRYVWLLLNNGLAVDLFMLLSGFLMYSIHSEADKSRPWEFWTRRFFRLAPLYYFCLAIGFLGMPWFAQVAQATWDQTPRLHGWPLVWSAQNFGFHLTFLFGLSPTLQQSTPMPDWSLTLEAQFYLVFPFLVAAMRRCSVSGVVVILLVVEVAVYLAFHAYVSTYVFPSLLVLKLHVFLSGILIAAATKMAVKARWLVLFLALISALIPVPDGGMSYTLCRVALVLLVSACTQNVPWKGTASVLAFFSLPKIRWVGEISYGVYLVHLVFMYGALAYMRSALGESHAVLFSLTLVMTIVGSFGLATLLHHWVEIPGIALGRMLISRQRTFKPGFPRFGGHR